MVNICLIPFLGLLGSIALAPFFPVIARDLGTTVPLLGQIPAVTMALAAVLALVAGPLADHYGNRRLLLIGLLALIGSSLSIALAPTVIVLFGTVMVGSLSRAILQPVSLAIAGIHFHGEMRRRAISLVLATTTGAGIVGVPVLTTIGAALGWRLAFVTMAVLAVALVVLSVNILPRDEQSADTSNNLSAIFKVYGPLLRHPTTLGLLASSVLTAATIWGIWTYLGAFLVEVQGLTVPETGVVYSLFGVGFFLGSVIAGGRLGQQPLRPLIIVACTLAGLVFLSVFLLPVGPIIVAVLLPTGTMLLAVATVARTTLLVTDSPAGRATTMTLNASGASLGSAIGSSLGGGLLVVGGYEAIGLGALLLTTTAAFLVWLSRPRTETVEVVRREVGE